MKKIMNFRNVVMVLLVTFFAASCHKANEDDVSVLKEVSFSSKEMPKSGLKSSNAQENADYASIVINGTTYTPAVYYLDGVAYTQGIKLPVGDYTLTQFLLMTYNNTPNDMSDDSIVSAVPEVGSQYASFVNTPLEIQFHVGAFEKNEIPVEVLSFTSAEFEAFGFNWFTMSQTTVREQLFFGDISMKHPADYAGSLYEQQTNGLQVDMPAIFKIKVYRNDLFVAEYDNEAWLGEGDILHVAYPDGDNTIDHFRFDLYIYVKIGASFDYKFFHSWTFDDDELIDSGSDGVVDFVLGNAIATTPDLLLPPYINLPVSCTYTIGNTYAPGTQGGYVDATISGVGNGYDFNNGAFASWCGDLQTTIGVGVTYDMDVYSSLYPDLLPAYASYGEKWSRVNWIFNNLDKYPGYTWGELQGAIWKIMNSWNGSALGGVPSADATVDQMVNDSQSHTDFTPLPGGWAAVIFVPQGTPPESQNPNIQTVFIQVDP
jgi:hypothetical protein